ncbi:MAG: hypothetical protein Q9228_006204 [Teloschistes exilis]
MCHEPGDQKWYRLEELDGTAMTGTVAGNRLKKFAVREEVEESDLDEDADPAMAPWVDGAVEGQDGEDPKGQSEDDAAAASGGQHTEVMDWVEPELLCSPAVRPDCAILFGPDAAERNSLIEVYRNDLREGILAAIELVRASERELYGRKSYYACADRGVDDCSEDDALSDPGAQHIIKDTNVVLGVDPIPPRHDGRSRRDEARPDRLG